MGSFGLGHYLSHCRKLNAVSTNSSGFSICGECPQLLIMVSVDPGITCWYSSPHSRGTSWSSLPQIMAVGIDTLPNMWGSRGECI